MRRCISPPPSAGCRERQFDASPAHQALLIALALQSQLPGPPGAPASSVPSVLMPLQEIPLGRAHAPGCAFRQILRVLEDLVGKAADQVIGQFGLSPVPGEIEGEDSTRRHSQTDRQNRPENRGHDGRHLSKWSETKALGVRPRTSGSASERVARGPQLDRTQRETPSGWNVRSTAPCNSVETAFSPVAVCRVFVNCDNVRAASACVRLKR